MRASRTGVINLKPIGRTATAAVAAATAAGTTAVAVAVEPAAVVTNYLDARRVRVVGAVGTGLLGTLGRYSWRTIAVCTVRVLCDSPPVGEPANGTSARERVRVTRGQNEMYGCSFLWGRDPADGQATRGPSTGLIGEIARTCGSFQIRVSIY